MYKYALWLLLALGALFMVVSLVGLAPAFRPTACLLTSFCETWQYLLFAVIGLILLGIGLSEHTWEKTT